MRGRIWFRTSSTSWVDLTIRSTVWQLTQLSSESFCCCEPGTLMIHSPFESWRARFLVLMSLRSAVAGVPAGGSVERGPLRSWAAAPGHEGEVAGPGLGAGGR